jgi:CPA2 family monovalent cation:H+ antiporter-2
VDRKLPRSLQTFAALYASWLEQLRKRPADGEAGRFRRAIRWIIVDAVIVAAIVIGASVEMDRIVSMARSGIEISERTMRWLVIAGAGVVSAPFWIGLVRMARYLGFELATMVFPVAGLAETGRRQQLDLAAAPRRLLVVTLQLAIVLVIGIPLIAITQPFLPPFRGAAVLLFVLLLLAIAFWRGAANLQGHTRAAAEALAESLARQTRIGRESTEHAFDEANQILAGMGSPVPVEVVPGSAAEGRTLAEIKLRGLTGATVLAIRRGDESLLVPSGHERLQAGDILAIAGTHEAVRAAKNLLSKERAQSHDGKA